MSIINDALKKTQLSFKKKDKVPQQEQKKESVPEQSTSNVYEKLHNKQMEKRDALAAAGPKGKGASKTTPLRSAKRWIKVSVTIVICALLLWGGYLFLPSYKPAQDFFRSIRREGTNSRSYIAKRIPKPRTYKAGELFLNGTSLIDDKRVALINDEIYEVGEMVDGREIISISLDKIELSDNENIITLRVH